MSSFLIGQQRGKCQHSSAPVARVRQLQREFEWLTKGAPMDLLNEDAANRIEQAGFGRREDMVRPTDRATATVAQAVPDSRGTYNGKYRVWFNAMVPGGFYSWDPDDLRVHRSIRTNNPGALNYSQWQKSRPGFVSITPPDSYGNRTTIYSMPEYGVGAWYHLISQVYGYARAGEAFTLSQLARSYAGRNASQSQVNAYVKGWCHFADIPMTGDSEFHLVSDEDMSALGRAMFKHEAAGVLKISNDQILSGI